MRITGGRLIDQAAASTANAQTAVGKLADEVSSGMRVRQPSDDPTAWLAAHRAGLRRSLEEGTGAAIQVSRDRLDETDAALATIGDALSQARALAVDGASDNNDANARAALGLQVRGLFQGALAAANARGVDGEFVLAGASSLTEPFDATGRYVGDGSTRSVPSGDGTTSAATVPGSDLTVSRGVDILPLLDRVATALAGNDPATLRAALPDLDTAIRQLSHARGIAGGAMTVLDQARDAQSALAQHMSEDISRYVEVDTVSAASDLAKASQALEASRAVSQHVIALLARPSA